MSLHIVRRVALALPSMVLALAAQADAISTDRPDFVESSDVVGKGHVQIETGFQSEREAANGIRTRTRTTPTLLRIGLNDALEFRAETDGLTLARSTDSALGASSTQRGWADVSLGLKWRTQDGDEDKGTPSMAWLVHADLDTGSAAFRGQGVRPSLRFVAEWELAHEVSVGVMPGIVLDRNAAGKRFVSSMFAVTVSKGWTREWHTFVELAGQQFAARRNGGSLVSVDAGATYLVNDSLQLDVSFARGLTRETPDFQWGVGASFRF